MIRVNALKHCEEPLLIWQLLLDELHRGDECLQLGTVSVSNSYCRNRLLNRCGQLFSRRRQSTQDRLSDLMLARRPVFLLTDASHEIECDDTLLSFWQYIAVLNHGIVQGSVVSTHLANIIDADKRHSSIHHLSFKS